MDTKLQPVTGNEAFWGDVKLTPSQLDLVNKSPTLVAQIHEGDARVAAGDYRPIAVRTDLPGDGGGAYDPETKRIIIPPRTFSSEDNSGLGTFAHEMGHFIYAPQDTEFERKYLAHVNPRDPGAYNTSAMLYVRAESEAEYNTGKIRKEIAQNTATPGNPGTSITEGNATIDAIDHAEANRPQGLTEKQNENRLIRRGMEAMATSGGHGATGSYDYYAHRSTGAAPIEPGGVASARYEGNDTTGDITSASEHWQSGDVSTQNYKDGKLQSTQTVDPSGKPLQTSSYAYKTDDSYGVTVKDGNGRTIQQSDFNADRSGVERGFNADGSRSETRFNGHNQTMQMTQYDPKGREKQKDHFDPSDGRDTNQVVTHPDGSRTLYSFNDRRTVGLQNEYDANGKPVASYRYDGSGRVTSTTRYRADGTRTVDTVGADGTGKQVSIDKQGNRSPEKTVTYDQATRQSLTDRSENAANVAPPQPVGAGNALGGQKNYYDPANNRLTNQIITNPDGSKTLNSYTDENLLGSQVQYGPDGKRVSSTSFNPQQGDLNQRVTYGADGGREVTHVDHDARTVKSTTYNAQNQVTTVRTTTPDSEQTEHYDPETGSVTVHATLNGDGSRSVSSGNVFGHEGARSTYDRNGKETSSVSYNPNEGTGTLTYVTRNPDGSRDVDKVDSSQHTFYSVDSNGQVHNRKSIPLSSGDKDALAQWKSGWQTQS
ncbi:RHS repeat protein [Paraburkholderia sp. Tr-20389]|uniref:hypothetical protein n=1 Tax=Paraburkholderia sp. Tr-20389 TaxID=2703903 RepID=UPI0019806E8E|nr:hypothetical protein [Paraburkholderia sp. Tr-20389]MBN3757693.1 RHS repeat protein [Paraburkholderia sp. Tr-20389]